MRCKEPSPYEFDSRADSAGVREEREGQTREERMARAKVFEVRARKRKNISVQLGPSEDESGAKGAKRGGMEGLLEQASKIRGLDEVGEIRGRRQGRRRQGPRSAARTTKVKNRDQRFGRRRRWRGFY